MFFFHRQTVFSGAGVPAASAGRARFTPFHAPPDFHRGPVAGGWSTRMRARPDGARVRGSWRGGGGWARKTCTAGCFWGGGWRHPSALMGGGGPPLNRVFGGVGPGAAAPGEGSCLRPADRQLLAWLRVRRGAAFDRGGPSHCMHACACAGSSAGQGVSASCGPTSTPRSPSLHRGVVLRGSVRGPPAAVGRCAAVAVARSRACECGDASATGVVVVPPAHRARNSRRHRGGAPPGRYGHPRVGESLLPPLPLLPTSPLSLPPLHPPTCARACGFCSRASPGSICSCTSADPCGGIACGDQTRVAPPAAHHRPGGAGAPPRSPPCLSPPCDPPRASAIGRNGDVCAAAAAPPPLSAAPTGPGRDVCGDDAAAAAEQAQDAAHTCQLSWCAACGGGKGGGGGGGGGTLRRGGGAAGGGVFPPPTVAPAVPGGGRRRRHRPQPRVPNTHVALGAVRRRWRRRGGTRLVDGGGLPLCSGGGSHRRGGGGAASRDGSERWRWRRGWPLPGFLPTRGADGGAGGGGQKTSGRRPPSVWPPHQRLAVHLVCVGVIHAHHVAWHGERGKDAAVPSLSPRRAAVPHFLLGDQLAGAGGGGRRWRCGGARWGGGGWRRRWPPAGSRRGAAVVFGARVDHVGAAGSGR